MAPKLGLQTVSSGHDPKRLTVGDRVFCVECGHPKEKTSFEPGSVICNACIPIHAQRLRVATEIAQSGSAVGFGRTLKELRKTSEPLVPAGVQKMNARLKGKSLYEWIAETFCELRGVDKTAEELKAHPRDFKAEVSLLKLMHDATKAHDEVLGADDPITKIDHQELEAVMVGAAVEQMIMDKTLRMKIFRAVYQQVPGFIQEILELSGSEVVSEGDPYGDI